MHTHSCVTRTTSPTLPFSSGNMIVGSSLGTLPRGHKQRQHSCWTRPSAPLTPSCVASKKLQQLLFLGATSRLACSVHPPAFLSCWCHPPSWPPHSSGLLFPCLDISPAISPPLSTFASVICLCFLGCFAPSMVTFLHDLIPFQASSPSFLNFPCPLPSCSHRPLLVRPLEPVCLPGVVYHQ